MKITVLLIFLSWSSAAIGQQLSNRQFSYGITLGANVQTLNIGVIRSSPSDPYALPGRPGIGVETGFWGKWTILPAVQLRTALSLSYSSNTIRFLSGDGQETVRRYPFAEIELPVHFLISSPLRRLPVRSIVLFGGRVSWNGASFPESAQVRLLPERLGLDLGIGAGFTWGKWEIQPEILYSFGVNNLHNFTNSAYDWAVGRILRDHFSFRLVLGKTRSD